MFTCSSSGGSHRYIRADIRCGSNTGIHHKVRWFWISGEGDKVVIGCSCPISEDMCYGVFHAILVCNRSICKRPGHSGWRATRRTVESKVWVSNACNNTGRSCYSVCV